MTIAIKPTASGSTIEQNGSTILTVDGSGNITPSNDLYPKVSSFSARLSADQSISSSTSTKLTFDTEYWDTNSCYDNATNYRFTPTTAGYYHISAIARASGTSVTAALIDLYKNGSIYTQLASSRDSTSSSQTLSGSTLVYMNGTTDYLEIYGTITATSPSFLATHTNFSAHLVSV